MLVIMEEQMSTFIIHVSPLLIINHRSWLTHIEGVSTKEKTLKAISYLHQGVKAEYTELIYALWK